MSTNDRARKADARLRDRCSRVQIGRRDLSTLRISVLTDIPFIRPSYIAVESHRIRSKGCYYTAVYKYGNEYCSYMHGSGQNIPQPHRVMKNSYIGIISQTSPVIKPIYEGISRKKSREMAFRGLKRLQVSRLSEAEITGISRRQICEYNWYKTLLLHVFLKGL